MYKIVDMNARGRKSVFKWFNSFSNPCYGVNIKVDVTNVIKLTKETKTSFFINFLYLQSVYYLLLSIYTEYLTAAIRLLR